MPRTYLLLALLDIGIDQIDLLTRLKSENRDEFLSTKQFRRLFKEVLIASIKGSCVWWSKTGSFLRRKATCLRA